MAIEDSKKIIEIFEKIKINKNPKNNIITMLQEYESDRFYIIIIVFVFVFLNYTFIVMIL